MLRKEICHNLGRTFLHLKSMSSLMGVRPSPFLRLMDAIMEKEDGGMTCLIREWPVETWKWPPLRERSRVTSRG